MSAACDALAIAALATRITLAVAFLVAGSLKIGRLDTARGLIHAAEVHPAFASSVGMYVVVVLELGVAGSLLTGIFALQSAVVAAAMLAGFAVVVERARRHGYAGSCGCYGSLETAPVGLLQVGRNSLMAAGALFVMASAGEDACAGASPLAVPAPHLALAGLLAVASLGSYLLVERVIRFAAIADIQPNGGSGS